MVAWWTMAFDRIVGPVFYPVHRYVYMRSGGRFGHRGPMGPMLLLTTTGRKTGQPRTTPLLYYRGDGQYVVVASNGARPSHPGWYFNITSNPEAEIQLGRRKVPVVAEEAGPDERARLWPKLTAFYSGWAGYQKHTDRQLPVIILRPRN